MMKTTDHSSFNNDWYQNDTNGFKKVTWYIVNAIIFNTSLVPISSVKTKLLVLFGAQVGKSVVIKPKVNIKYPWNLNVGDYSWIGENVWIDNLTKVHIGSHCCISQGAMLLTGNHNYKKTSFDLMLGEIKLENGTWIGAKTTVCPGVTAKSHSVLSVGSVATSNLEEYSIYNGNPAIKVKDRVID